jgi:hypothetical protein
MACFMIFGFSFPVEIRRARLFHKGVGVFPRLRVLSRAVKRKA